MTQPGFLSYKITPQRREQMDAIKSVIHITGDMAVIDFALEYVLLELQKLTEDDNK